jgi:hypothetical protein
MVVVDEVSMLSAKFLFGMVQANGGQKPVNHNIITSFLLSNYELFHASFSQYDAI